MYYIQRYQNTKIAKSANTLYAGDKTATCPNIEIIKDSRHEYKYISNYIFFKMLLNNYLRPDFPES